MRFILTFGLLLNSSCFILDTPYYTTPSTSGTTNTTDTLPSFGMSDGTFVVLLASCLLLLAGCILLLYFYQKTLRINKVLLQKLNEQQLEKIHLIDTISNSMDTNQTSNELKLFGRLEQLMKDKKIYQEVDINRKELANMLGTNENYLSKSIKVATNLTFKAYLLEYKLRYATQLLSETNKNAEEIGYEVGFGSRSTFFRQFKLKYGMTPLEYRKFSK